MFKKSLLAVFALLLIASSAIVTVFLFYSHDRPLDFSSTNQSIEVSDYYRLTVKEFNATARYQANNTWNYRIKGYLPNPCYSHSEQVEVVQQKGEKVAQLELTVFPTITAEEVCNQQQQPVDISGSYTADAATKFDFTLAD